MPCQEADGAQSPEWRIYYGCGGTFDSTEGPPPAAPPHDVQAVVQPDPRVGRIVLQRWDWYYYRSDVGQWWGSDIHGLLDQFMHHASAITAVTQGRHAADWETIRQRAIADPDFPVKEASLAGEVGS